MIDLVVKAMAIVALLGCGEPDPTETRCAPHRKLELKCADQETREALHLVGDMCQKILNGKNRKFFGPGDERRMEAELACAVAAKEDCASYATCRDRGGAGDLDE